MLDKDGFEAWAKEYDAAVEQSQSSGEYPFCGYDKVHERVFELVKDKKTVLDLGVGTARLTKRLYDRGIKIYGVDFSENMLNAARAKMPSAVLVNADLTRGLPAELSSSHVDAAIALYSIHHLTDARKLELIGGVRRISEKGGLFVIGDVAFETEADRLDCRARSGEEFDDDEYYCVFEKLAPKIGGARFEKISFCAGVITIEF